jgi:hypothetical protein
MTEPEDAPADHARAPDHPRPPDGGRPAPAQEVQYKGAPLDAARGPGLGCFWLQLAALAVLVLVTPLSVGWGWPEGVSAALLIATLILLLFAGQTVIFLLRLVAADRRAGARRAPLASRTRTVGQIEDESAPTPSNGSDTGEPESGVPE